MNLNNFIKVFASLLLIINGVFALARVDNWSQKRPNNTRVIHNQGVQSGYRPAVGYQQPQPQPPAQWNPYNQTRGQAQTNYHPQYPQHQSNNRTQYNYPPTVRPSAPAANQNPWMRNNQTQYYPPQPAYGQGSYNQSRQNYPPQPAYGQGSYNQSRQNYPSQPAYGQGSYNQSRPDWGQPPNSSYRPAQFPTVPSTNSHLYPGLPNNVNNRPALPSNSWTPPANQTLIYPPLPNNPIPAQPNVGNSGIPLAPLQPLNPQGPNNWQSGGQAALSYGPGQYPQPAGNANKSPPIRQGSSNPYANIFN